LLKETTIDFDGARIQEWPMSQMIYSILKTYYSLFFLQN